jgi:hypothetical protein
LREQTSVAGGPFAEPIAYVGGFLYWSTGSSGVYTPFARIDSQGNVDLNGTLRENSDLDFTLEEECHGATASRFRLSPRAFTPGLEYRTAGVVLHLKGRLFEQIEL